MRFNTLIDNEQFYTNTFENPYEIENLQNASYMLTKEELFIPITLN